MLERGGGGTTTFGVGTENVSSGVSFDHVTATASGGGINVGFLAYGSVTPAMSNLTATGTGGDSAYGVFILTGSTATLSNVTATAAGGSDNRGVMASGTVLIRDSFISGTTSVFRDFVVTRIANTVVNGVTQNVGPLNCVDVMTTALTPYTCA